ncbi:hypothetical protein [Janthinobacterium sp. NKUCC08_JDC]|uniref:hypothetical protein n=1 Tax=Janthinobacterium sp. NKUCC08_JDC TaxID=2842122 RepID=UPI001C5AF2A3|nr:hypothetical protein [Janthinobacterium sp. NKUCC08_JDC]MBW3498862.1 hypothetical protein [Janthinobacterium sp. NKUCC08_JDC]
MNPRHYRDMIIRAVGEPDGQTLDLIVSHVIDAERAKQILRANGYGMTGLSASATAALVPTISMRTRAVCQHVGCSADAARMPQFAATDSAFVQAVREWDALCAAQAVPFYLLQNP